MKTKTHYDPYSYNGQSGGESGGEYYDPGEYHLCGARVTAIHDTELTGNWEYVICKRCLRQKGKIDGWVDENEKAIVEGMGKMGQWWIDSKCPVCDGAGHFQTEHYPEPQCVTCKGTGLKQKEKTNEEDKSIPRSK